jgi:two-component sensor histidine kinase
VERASHPAGAMAGADGHPGADRPVESGGGAPHARKPPASVSPAAVGRYLVELLAVGAAYFALAKLGLTLASINPSATPIWPPTGLALAAVLLRGYRIWPAIFLAAFAANETTAGSVYTSFAIALGNTLECLVGGYLTRLWSGGTGPFDRPAAVARFALISLVAATPISATIGVGSLSLAGYADATRLASIWITWWLGDLAGALVITPVIVLWLGRWRRPFDRQLLEAGAVFALAVVIGIIAFSPLISQTAARDPLGFLAVLPLMWAALRCGQRDTAMTALVLCCFAIWGTMAGGGPFARETLNDSFLLLLMFIISTSVLSLVLSADVAVRKSSETHQRLLAAELDHRVRNTLASVQALAALSLRSNPSPEAFGGEFMLRLQALARAQSLLRRGGWKGASLDELVYEAVAPYVGAKAEKLAISGAGVRLSANAASTLSLALHELAANAAKHGALAAPSGRVMVTWRLHGDVIELRWGEAGGPPVRTPTRRGFGLELIDRSITHEFAGEVEVDFAPSGFVCTLRLPLSGKVVLDPPG